MTESIVTAGPFEADRVGRLDHALRRLVEVEHHVRCQPADPVITEWMTAAGALRMAYTPDHLIHGLGRTILGLIDDLSTTAAGRETALRVAEQHLGPRVRKPAGGPA